MYCAKCGKPVKTGQYYCKSCAREEMIASGTIKNRKKKILIVSCTGILAVVLAVPAVRLIRNAFKTEDTLQTVNEQDLSTGDASELGIPSEKISAQSDAEKEVSEDKPTETQGTSRETLAQMRETEIMELEERRWMLQEAAKNLVMARLESTSFVTVDPRETFSVTDVVLDHLSGNLIVSEAAKAMYQSFSQGRSVQEICRSTMEGAVAQIPQYLVNEAEGALQDMVTDFIGVDIFSALDFISQWQNADDMPVVLLQAIVDEQQKDVCRLTLFLEQENIGAADMYKVAQLMYAIQMREQEIAAIQDVQVEENLTDFSDMRVLAGQYAANEAKLLFLVQTEISEKDTIPEEEGLESLTSLQESAKETLEAYRELENAELGNISVNYDVEGFRLAQKSTSQEMIFDKTVAGDLLGGLLAEGDQMNEDWVQENRAVLCDKITDFLEESYLEVAVAEEVFMRQYGITQEMATASGDDGYLAELYLEQVFWKEQLQEAADLYSASLARYLFDLDSAYILYECILTDQQTDFLFELASERDQAASVLEAVGKPGQAGYSDEEAAERWDSLLECYIQNMDQIIEYGSVLGKTPALYSNGSLTVYGDGTYRAYSKKQESSSRPIAIFGRWSPQDPYNPKYYYDTRGNLLCVVYGNVKITYRSNVLYSYTNVDKKMYAWDMEPGGMDINLATNYTKKAEDMYRQFAK